MKRKLIFLSIITGCLCPTLFSQTKPCSGAEFRKLDFWIGEWNVYDKNNKVAGSSKISLILDSCVILEEWTSSSVQQNLVFKGKSFNSFNAASRQWQQTWTDNTGNTTEFLRGTGTNGQVIYYADKVADVSGKYFMRRLTFTKLADDKVRQLGERSDDEGKTWTTEYDLEYRRNKS